MKPSETIVCIGTGPSLSLDDIEIARKRHFTLFACNNAVFMTPGVALLYACNLAWWDHYWKSVKHLPCQKWTTNSDAAAKFGINWIAERNRPGLSEDDDVIHHGHGSGYSLVSMAYRWRPRRILLLGYDCKYAPDYDGKAHQPGSTPRHYFGEYPSSMQHWPSVQVKDGVHVELVELYQSIADQGLVEIINCTPDSAIDAFPHAAIGDA